MINQSQPRWPGERWDLVQRVTGWLFGRAGATVLIGDPGRSLPKDRLEAVATYQVPVTRSLEDSDIKRSTVCRRGAVPARRAGSFRD
jgi:hypothetical protein